MRQIRSTVFAQQCGAIIAKRHYGDDPIARLAITYMLKTQTQLLNIILSQQGHPHYDSF